MESNDVSANKQIRNLLVVVASAVFLAFIGLFLLLRFSSGDGAYLAKNVLLSPESARLLRFNDSNPLTGGKTRFVLEKIEFSYYDEKRQVNHIDVDIASYAKLYEFMGNTASLLGNIDGITELFHTPSARLLLRVHSEGSATGKEGKVFSEIEFVRDYYRVALRGQEFDKQWVYFKQPGILEYTFKQLTGS